MRQHHGLRAKLLREFGNQFRAIDSGCVDGHFIRAGQEHLAAFIHSPNAAAGGERDIQLLGYAADGIEKRGASFERRADIEHDELIRAFAIVASSQIGRIAHIAQALELDAFHDAAAIDIEAGNDAPRERHCTDSTKFCSTRAPVSPDFSGWNCTARKFCLLDHGCERRLHDRTRRPSAQPKLARHRSARNRSRRPSGCRAAARFRCTRRT